MAKKKLDKRTKEYKNSIKNKRPVLLGDVIEDITENTGIKKVVKKIVKNCGCDERKEYLNINYELGISRYKVRRCMTDEQIVRYKQFQDERTLNVSRNQLDLLIELFAHVFAIQYLKKDFCTNCSGSGKRIISMQQKLDKVVLSYEKL